MLHSFPKVTLQTAKLWSKLASTEETNVSVVLFLTLKDIELMTPNSTSSYSIEIRQRSQSKTVLLTASTLKEIKVNLNMHVSLNPRHPFCLVQILLLEDKVEIGSLNFNIHDVLSVSPANKHVTFWSRLNIVGSCWLTVFSYYGLFGYGFSDQVL